MSSVPVTRPTARYRRSRAKRRVRVNSQTTQKAITFFTIAAFAYLASSMVGQVMVEKARREGIHAMQRAVDARKTEAQLSKRLDELTSLESITDWAHSHDFYSQEELIAPAAGAAPLATGVPGPAEDMPLVTIRTRDKGQGTSVPDGDEGTWAQGQGADLQGTGDKGQGTRAVSPAAMAAAAPAEDPSAVPNAEGRAAGDDPDGTRVAVPAYSGSSWATTGPAPAIGGAGDKGQENGLVGTRDTGQGTSGFGVPQIRDSRAKGFNPGTGDDQTGEPKVRDHRRSRLTPEERQRLGIFSPDRLPRSQEDGARDNEAVPSADQVLGQALNPAAGTTDASAVSSSVRKKSKHRRHHRGQSNAPISRQAVGQASTPGGAEAAPGNGQIAPAPTLGADSLGGNGTISNTADPSPLPRRERSVTSRTGRGGAHRHHKHRRTRLGEPERSGEDANAQGR